MISQYCVVATSCYREKFPITIATPVLSGNAYPFYSLAVAGSGYARGPDISPPDRPIIHYDCPVKFIYSDFTNIKHDPSLLPLGSYLKNLRLAIFHKHGSLPE